MSWSRATLTAVQRAGTVCLTLATIGVPRELSATEWFVASGAVDGSGSREAPFAQLQEGLDAAQPGDVIVVGSGIYLESLRTVRAGSVERPIRVRADRAREATVRFSGSVLRLDHANIVIEGLVFDARYAVSDAVIVGERADGSVLRDVEVLNTSRDCIDIRGSKGLLIERSSIHHCLNATGGRTDAHGIVASGVENLVIRDTEIHTFSGDGVQIDPLRRAWDDVVIERCRIWLAPLEEARNGFPAETVPGENAVDTKAASEHPRATLTIRDSDAWGFRRGLLENMAAFNVKENVEALIDGVTVFESEIAFRIRGSTRNHSQGARVTIQNAVVYDVGVGVRYENSPESLRVWNCTLGAGVRSPFDGIASSRSRPDVRNLLALAARLPFEARWPSNLAVAASSFQDVTVNDYRLRDGSPAIDTGEELTEVAWDRNRVRRPQQLFWDIGAYEYSPEGSSRP